MKIKLIILLVITSFFGCKAYKYTNVQMPNIYDSLDFFELKDTINVRVFDYLHGGHSCGVIMTASCCLGITKNDDTLRILTLCEEDTTIKKGIIVRVIPQEKPDFQVEIPVFYIDNASTKKITFPKYYYKKYKTTYGKIVKVE